MRIKPRARTHHSVNQCQGVCRGTPLKATHHMALGGQWLIRAAKYVNIFSTDYIQYMAWTWTLVCGLSISVQGCRGALTSIKRSYLHIGKKRPKKGLVFHWFGGVKTSCTLHLICVLKLTYHSRWEGKLLHCGFCEAVVVWSSFFIPPATKLVGVYWIQPVCLSVRLSVCLSVNFFVSAL